MPAYSIAIKDDATRHLSALSARLASRAMLDALGEAGAQSLRDNFGKKEMDPSTHRTASALGARPQNLFAQFVQSTSYSVTSESAVVSVTHDAIRQRLEGGTIRPVLSRALAIPANAAAYGHRAREFQLRAVYFKNPQANAIGMLIAETHITESVQRRVRGKVKTVKTIRQAAGVYYWLIAQARQDADPTVLPTDAQFISDVEAALDGYLEG